MIRARLAKHESSVSTAGSLVGQTVAAAQPLACSWVVNAAWEYHQRLELRFGGFLKVDEDRGS